MKTNLLLKSLLLTTNNFLSFYRHASEICRMALDLQAACGMVVRPDIRPKTIMIQCGIHTGPVVAGKSLESAANAIEELENTAKLALILTGQNPKLLNNKNINDVINKFKIKWD